MDPELKEALDALDLAVAKLDDIWLVDALAAFAMLVSLAALACTGRRRRF